MVVDETEAAGSVHIFIVRVLNFHIPRTNAVLTASGGDDWQVSLARSVSAVSRSGYCHDVCDRGPSHDPRLRPHDQII